MSVVRDLMLLSMVFGTGASIWGADERQFWISPWDKRLPAMVMKDVALEGDDIAPLWKTVCSAYLVRCNLYMTENPPVRKFSFKAEECRFSDVLDALTVHFGYVWNQDEQTGVIWLHPEDIDIKAVLGSRVEVSSHAVAVPMHSGVLEPIREIMPWGAFFTQAWSNLWLATFDYPVCIPSGAYSVRDVVNYCCIWRPSQAFAVTASDIGTYIMDVNVPYADYKRPAPGSRLFWEVELGEIGEGVTPTDEEIGLALRDRDPRKRWAARCYLSLCVESEDTYFRTRRRLAKMATGEAAAWEAIGVGSATIHRPDIFPAGDEIVRHLQEASAPNVMQSFSPEGILFVALYTAVYTKDYSVLAQLSGLEDVDTDTIIFDLLAASNFSPEVAAALFDAKSPNYVGNLLKRYPWIDDAAYRRIRVTAVSAQSE